MPVTPKEVVTHRLALASEYVKNVAHITLDGFTSEYFTMVIEEPNLTVNHQHASVELSVASGEFERYLVRWEPADVARAVAAGEADFRESVGDAAADGIDAMRALLTKVH